VVLNYKKCIKNSFEKKIFEKVYKNSFEKRVEQKKIRRKT